MIDITSTSLPDSLNYFIQPAQCINRVFSWPKCKVTGFEAYKFEFNKKKTREWKVSWDKSQWMWFNGWHGE